MDGEKDHWLVRPATIKAIWVGSIAVLAALVIADFFIEKHPHFGLDGLPGFSAWFGFAACVVLVAGAKGLGVILKRKDDYYGG